MLTVTANCSDKNDISKQKNKKNKKMLHTYSTHVTMYYLTITYHAMRRPIVCWYVPFKNKKTKNVPKAERMHSIHV